MPDLPNDFSPEESRMSFSMDDSVIKTQEYQFLGTVSGLEREIVKLLFSREIQRSQDFFASFSGIKRLLGDVHQQSLTNALTRLIGEGFLDKTKQGYYSLSSSARKLSLPFKGSPGDHRFWNPEFRGIPYNIHYIPVDRVLSILSGKWFGQFRFLGKTYDRQKSRGTIEWIGPNNAYLLVEVCPTEIMVRFRRIDDLNVDKALQVIQMVCMDTNVLVVFNRERSIGNNFDGN